MNEVKTSTGLGERSWFTCGNDAIGQVRAALAEVTAMKMNPGATRDERQALQAISIDLSLLVDRIRQVRDGKGTEY